MSTFLFECFILLLVLPALVTSASAAPIACVGTACGAAAFPSTPAFCTSVEVSVAYKAGCGGITIRGGDVYPIGDDMQCAAQHYGIVSSTNPGPVTAYLFHAGTRPQFYRVRKNTITSAALTTGGEGVIFGMSTTCPVLYTSVTPVTNVSQGYTGGTIFGAGYFTTTTTLVNDAIEVMALTVGAPSIVYIREIGLRDRFYKSWSNGLLTQQSLTSEMAYSVWADINLEMLANPKPEVTLARADCYTWFPGMADTFYGTGVYPHDTMLCLAQRHQYARAGMFMYLCHEVTHNVFYSSAMLGMTSTFKYDAGGLTAYSIAKSSAGCTILPANVHRTRVNLHTLATVNVWGYHYYRYDSDVAMAAFVQGHAIPWFPQEAYIHEAGFFTNFYKGTYSDVTTQAAHGASQRAYFVSDSVTVPAATDIYPLRIRMYGTIGQTATGTGVYSESSDVTNICFHYLSCNLGFTYIVHALHIGSAGYYLYASTHRQLTTTYGGNTGGQIYLSYHSVALAAITAEVNTPTIMKLLTRSTTIVGGPIIGVNYYRDTSDIALCALHSGVLKGDANETIFVHRDANQKVFYSLTNNSLTSTALNSASFQTTIRISATVTALTPYADSTLSTVRLAVTFACLWLPTGPLYGITYYPVGQDLLAAAIMEHYCRPTADHTDQFTIYVQYGFNMNRILGTSTPALNTAAFYSGTAFRTHIINNVDAQPEGWTALNTGQTSLPARVIYHGQLDTSVIYGTTPHFHWQNLIAKTAFFAGVVNDMGVVVKIYYRVYTQAATTQIFIGSTHRGIRSMHLEGNADNTRIYFAATSPVPAITDDLYYLCFKEIHRAVTPDTTGTVWYKVDSNFGIAAYRENLINFRQCAWLYVRPIGATDFFLKSTQRGYQSSGENFAVTYAAFMIKALAGDPYSMPTLNTATGYPIPFYHAVVRPWEVAKTVIVVGMNPFSHDTDATYGAYMHNILNPKETKTLYLFKTSRNVLPSTTSRRVVSSSNLPATAVLRVAFILSESSAGQAWMGTTNTFKLFLTIEDYDPASPGPCVGATVFRFNSDMSVCARIAGKGGMGDTFELTVLTVGTFPGFAPINTNGLSSTSSAVTANGVLIDSGATPTHIAGTYLTTDPSASMFYFSMRNTSLETGMGLNCKGHQVYGVSCHVAAAAQHAGLANIGDNTIIYGLMCGSNAQLYGSTQNGITTTPSCVAEVSYTLSLTKALLTCTPVLKLSIPPYRPWGTATGAGYFAGTTPIDVAAVEAGWITPAAAGAPVNVYIQTTATANTQFLGASTFTVNSGLGVSSACGFYISTSSGTTSAFSFTSTCYTAQVRLLDPATACPNLRGTIHYRWDSSVGCAAAHRGLITVGNTAVTPITVCKINSASYKQMLLASYNNGIQSFGQGGSISAPGGWFAFTVDPGPPATPTANTYTITIPIQLTGLETVTPDPAITTTTGSGASIIYYYSVATINVAHAAYAHGILTETVKSATVTLTVYVTLTGALRTFSFPAGSAPKSRAAAFGFPNTYTTHGGGCALVALTGAITGNVYGTNYFSNNGLTNLARAAVMVGALEAGENGTVTICPSGNRRVYRSVRNFISSLSTATAVSTVCFGAGCNGAASVTPLVLTFVHYVPCTTATTFGAVMTRHDSCTNLAAYVANYISYNTETTIYIHDRDGDPHCAFFYSIFRGILGTTASTAAAACGHFSLSAGSDPGVTASTMLMYVEHTIATTSPQGTYYYTATTGTVNDMLEHQERVSIFNPATFTVNILAGRTYQPASTQGGIASTNRWTNLGTATSTQVAFSIAGWNLESNVANIQQTPLWVGYLSLPTASSMTGIPEFVGPTSEMIQAGAASEIIPWTFFQWPINDAMPRTKFWVKAIGGSKRILHAIWILGIQSVFSHTGANREFVRILASYDTSAITPASADQQCINYPRVPAHVDQATASGLEGTRWFTPRSDITRAAIQEGRFVFKDPTSAMSRNFLICTNRVVRTATSFMSITNNSVYSVESAAYTDAYIMGGTWGVFYDWPEANQFVDRIFIKSALWVERLQGGLDHFIRPFDIAAALVARGDEDPFTYNTPQQIYFKGPTAAHGNVHVATSNAGLTQSYCGANQATYFSTTVNADTIQSGRYRAFYDSDLSPRYFYHTVPYPMTNAPIAGGNTWDTMVYGSHNEYAAKISTCPGAAGTYQFFAAGSSTTTPWYYTDIKAAFWEARWSNFDETQYWIYVHNHGTQSRGYLGHNRYGMLTKGSEYYSEYNSGIWHNIFSFSNNNVNPGFSTSQQTITLNSCEHVASVVYGVGLHTGDSDPCGAAFLRRRLQIDNTGTFYVRWYYNSGYDMPFFLSAYSFGQHAEPHRLRRKIYYSLSTVSGSQDTSVQFTHTANTGFTITVSGLQVVPSFQFGLITGLSNGVAIGTAESNLFGAYFWYMWFGALGDILLHGNQRRYLDSAFEVRVNTMTGWPSPHYTTARNGPYPSLYVINTFDSTYFDPSQALTYRHRPIQVYATTYYHTSGYTSGCTPPFTVSPNPLNCPNYVTGVGVVKFDSDLACSAWLAGKCPAWELCNVTLCPKNTRTVFHYYNKLGLLNKEQNSVGSTSNGWWLTIPGVEPNAVPSKKDDALFCLNLNCTNRPTGANPFPARGSTYYQSQSELCTAGVHINKVHMDQTNVEICTSKVVDPPQGWWYSSSRRHVWTTGRQASGAFRVGFVLDVAQATAIYQPTLTDGIDFCPEYVQSTTCPGSGGYHIDCDMAIAVYREAVTFFARCYIARPFPINTYGFAVGDQETIGNRQYRAGSTTLHMTNDRFKNMHTTTAHAAYYAVPLQVPMTAAAATVVVNPANQAVCTATSDLMNCMRLLGFISNVSVGWRLIVTINYDAWGNYWPSRFNPTRTPTFTMTLTQSSTPSYTQSLSSTTTLSLTQSLSVNPTRTRTHYGSKTATYSLSSTVSLSPTTTMSPTTTASLSVSTSPTISTSLSPTSSHSATTTQSKSETTTPSTTVTPSPTSTVSLSETVSHSQSQSQSLSTTLSLSDTQSPSASSSVSPSATHSGTFSIVHSLSTTPLLTPSMTLSTTESLSPSTSATSSTTLSPTGTTSLSETASLSKTASLSPTTTLSLSDTHSISMSTTLSPSTSISPTGSLSISPIPPPTVTSQLTDTATLTMSPQPTFTVTMPDTASTTTSLSETQSSSQSTTASLSTSATKSATGSISTSSTHSASDTASRSQSTSVSTSVSRSATTTMSLSSSTSPSQTMSMSVSTSPSRSQSVSVSTSVSTSGTASLSRTWSVSDSVSVTLSPSATTSASTSLTLSHTPSLSASASTSVSASTSRSSSVSATTSASATASTSASSSVSMSPTQTVSLSRTATLSSTATVSTSPSASISTSISASPSVTGSRSTSGTSSLTASTTASDTQSTSASTSVSATASTSASTSRSHSTTISPSQTQSTSVSGSVSVSTTRSLSTSASISTSASVSQTSSVSLSATVSPSVSPSSTPSATASLSTTVSLSTSGSVSTSTSQSRSSTISLSPTRSTSTSGSVSVSTTRSLSTTASISTSTSVSQTSSVSLSSSVSPTTTDTMSLTGTHSLSTSMTLSSSASLTSSATHSITDTHSLTSSASLSPTQTRSLSATNSLSSSTSHTHTTTLSLTDSQSLTATFSITETIPPTLTIPATPTISFEMTNTSTISSSISESKTPTPTYYPDLKTITFGKEIIFKNPVKDENGTVPSNSASLISKSLEDSLRNPVWFLFVVCLISALCALVLLVLIGIAVYRRWQQYQKERNMRRRAARYMKRKVRRRVKRRGSDGVEYSTTEEVFEDVPEGEEWDNQSSSHVDTNEGEGGHTIDTGSNDAIVNFDPIAHSPPGDGAVGMDIVMPLESQIFSSFKKEFQSAEIIGGKRAQRLAKEGKGAKLEAMNVTQFQRRNSSEDPHLMPNKKKELFVEDILDPEKAQPARRDSISVLFNEVNRGNAGLVSAAGPAAHGAAGAVAGRSDDVAALLQRQLDMEASRSNYIDPTSEEYDALCRRTSMLNVNKNAPAGAALAGAGGAATAHGPSFDPSKVGRYKRGIYFNDGSGPTDAPGAAAVAPSPAAPKIHRPPPQEGEAVVGSSGAAGAGAADAPLRAGYVPTAVSAQAADGYEGFDFEADDEFGQAAAPSVFGAAREHLGAGVVGTAAALQTATATGAMAARGAGDEEDADGPKAEAAERPLVAAAGVTAGGLLHTTAVKASGMQALRLGDDMNDFDDFEAAEDYDFSILHGKSKPALDAEAILASKKGTKSKANTRASIAPSAVSVGDVQTNFFANDDGFDVDAIAAELGLDYGDDDVDADAATEPAAARPMTTSAAAGVAGGVAGGRDDDPLALNEDDERFLAMADDYDFSNLVGDEFTMPLNRRSLVPEAPGPSHGAELSEGELEHYFDDINMDSDEDDDVFSSTPQSARRQ